MFHPLVEVLLGSHHLVYELLDTEVLDEALEQAVDVQ